MPRSPKKLAAASAPETIGFRLDPSASKTLADRARRLGVSSHQLARDYVMQALQAGDQEARLKDATDSVHAHLHELREDLSLALEALIIVAGDLEQKEARAWMKQNFPCYPSPSL